MEFDRAVGNHNDFRTRHLSDMYLKRYVYTILLDDCICHDYTMTVHAYEHCPAGKE
jgi:hypothetical protein